MKRPKNKPLYLFECGCTLPFPKRNQQPWEKENYKYVCPVHHLPVKNKIYKCIKCGKTIITSFTVNIKLYCTDCRWQECKKYSKNAYARRKARRRVKAAIKRGNNRKNPPADLSPARKSDCKHYLSRCLQVGGVLLSDPKACSFCRHYEKKSLDKVLEEYHDYHTCPSEYYKYSMPAVRAQHTTGEEQTK